jgi:hypothetical protein
VIAKKKTWHLGVKGFSWHLGVTSALLLPKCKPFEWPGVQQLFCVTTCQTHELSTFIQKLAGLKAI